ncbi:uncharacterized protein MONOS_15677 [Monocercomonoides exilis]|uniref:uncharacterized protein n=1 Tax=Monocercomonoides exilis TaxID=2049356 RepID=UPI00355A0B83|nr:hypothetical protein MONOS_15677 [Monocercomonoides exilis]|eukprot:MONOS_15677.1-p1 / transcript=MONOS_15677.1 / gene=MONOS_15677 / organism=Monocercomonoides_exilis_PA203 / gene_product=unspecified product / transcript_product=unspecified product / location=Mono_scaffold01307:7909-8226(-) / protein_length=106 / sequence_SO=supercontig / SO=protein_coding / is_pseudo=false
MAISESDKARSRRWLEMAGGMEEKGLNGLFSIVCGGSVAAASAAEKAGGRWERSFYSPVAAGAFFAEMLKEIILLVLDLKQIWEEDWLEKAFKTKEERLNRPFVC